MAEQENKNAQRVQRRTAGGKTHETRGQMLQAPVWRDGQWTRPDLPTFGWTRVAVEAPANSQFVCMACNKVFDGPPHLLRHRSFGGMVRVDPACSGNMRRTAAAAQASPASLDIDRAAKRPRWLGRAWKRNADGQSILNGRDFFVTVSFTGRSWGFVVRPKKTEDIEWKRSGFRSGDEAKLAAFDEITKRLKQQARRTRDEDA